MRNGSEETADPQPAGTLGRVFRWGRVGWFYSRGLYRCYGNADTNRRSFALVVSGARRRCERRDARNGCVTYPPAKARAAHVVGEQDRGGGWVWRVGTRSGFGRPGRPGFFGGGVGVAALNRARGTRVLVSAAR